MARKGETGKAKKPTKTSPEEPTKTVYVSTVTQYLKEINKLTSNNKDAKLIYRGQKDSKDPVNCGAARRYINSGHIGEITKQDLLEYHNDYLLENAKKIGLNFKDGRELKDMELIADLQHHGCATMLIDFTRDPLIALFFATEQSSRDKNANGAVFVLRIDDTKRFKELSSKDLCGDECIKNKLTNNDNNYLYFWEPTQLNKRIPAQHSVFVFGEPEISSKDILLKFVIMKTNEASEKGTDISRPPKEESKRKKIQNYKVRIQEILQNSHDLNNTVLFNDLPGFSYANNHKAKLEITTPQYLITKARECFQQNQYNQSIEYYSRYIKKIRNNSIAFLERGNAYAFSNNIENAIKDFKKAILLDPKLAIAYNNLGSAKLDLGIMENNNEYFKDSIKEFDKAIELNQNYSKAFTNRGSALYKLKKYEQAIEDFNNSIYLDQKNAMAYYNRGISYFDLGKSKSEKKYFEKALADFDQSIEIDPQKAKFFNNRGVIKNQLLRYEEAIEDFDKAIEIDPTYPFQYSNRGFAKAKLGRLNSAKRDYMEVVYLLLINDNYKDVISTLETIEKIFLFENIYIYKAIAYWLIDRKEESQTNYLIAKKLPFSEGNLASLKILNECFNDDGSLKENWKDSIKKHFKK